MPFQNRVQPTGDIIVHPSRGRFMGNRGILHDEAQQLGTARWRLKAWVTCRLSFKGRHRQIMAPRRYTELFFWDEAVAFAAGHRPCAECRRGDFNNFKDAAGITGKIKAFDDVLHADRALMRPYRQRRTVQHIDTLPAGVFVLDHDIPTLLTQDSMLPFSPAGYGERAPRKRGVSVTLLTPMPLVNALRGGYTLDIRSGKS